MAESYDIFRYISYLRSRWLWIAASGAVAVVVALVASLAMPRQYTATAQIVIEPPAGADPRSAMAVSPIYLESLKTYEHFAAGDSLFEKAIDKFTLRGLFGARPIESIKKRVLRVDTVRNTRILEISATLPDARQALALARYLAESTVALSQSTASESERDLMQGVEQQEREIRAEMEGLDASWARLDRRRARGGLASRGFRSRRFAQRTRAADAGYPARNGRRRRDGRKQAPAQSEAREEAANAAARAGGDS